MVNLRSANQHVPKIYRRIQVVKKICRATRHGLPFVGLPFILTINTVLNNVNILGYFPTTSGILTTISPRAIITGETLNYKRHRVIPFGQYCQIHEEETPRNSTRPLTRGSICMGPRGNKHGGFNFMTLGYMKNLVRQSQDALPMPDTVIARVNALGQGKPNDIDFIDCNNCPIVYLDITGVDDG